MSTRAFCLARRKTEIPTFVKVLKAVPQERQDYRPEPRSRTAAELAGLLAAEEAALVRLLDTGKVQWKDQPPGARMADIVGALARSGPAGATAPGRARREPAGDPQSAHRRGRAPLSRRGSLIATLVAAWVAAAAPAGGQSVQYRSAAGVEYRSQRDTGAIARAESALAADPRNVERTIQLGVAQSGEIGRAHV